MVLFAPVIATFDITLEALKTCVPPIWNVPLLTILIGWLKVQDPVALSH